MLVLPVLERKAVGIIQRRVRLHERRKFGLRARTMLANAQRMVSAMSSAPCHGVCRDVKSGRLVGYVSAHDAAEKHAAEFEVRRTRTFLQVVTVRCVCVSVLRGFIHSVSAIVAFAGLLPGCTVSLEESVPGLLRQQHEEQRSGGTARCFSAHGGPAKTDDAGGGAAAAGPWAQGGGSGRRLAGCSAKAGACIPGVHKERAGEYRCMCLGGLFAAPWLRSWIFRHVFSP